MVQPLSAARRDQAAPEGYAYGVGVESDPVAVDLNVDSALLLKSMVGIDAYPLVLALRPTIYRVEDQERVNAVVLDQLAEAGIVEDDRVHPQVEYWLQCLYRPDVELVARIIDTGYDGEPPGMLRFSLVRSGGDHVLAVRNDDHIVIQAVYSEGQKLNTVAAALSTALGWCPVPQFAPLSAMLDQFADFPVEQEERRQALLELGADHYAARVLSRGTTELTRRSEVVMVEHHDGGSTQTEYAMNVFDSECGRVIVSPSVGMDGQPWSTFAPGDDTTLRAGLRSLVELLPGRSWFDTARTDY